MDIFILQLDEGALKELLERTILKGTALIQVGEQGYIENMNEEAKRLTGLHPMSRIDEILSLGAHTALRDCIKRKVSHTISEELDDKLYELEIVPHREGALLAYLFCDRSVYDGSLRIVQAKSSKYIGSLLGAAGKVEDPENADELRKQCMRLMRMLSHSDFLHEQPAPEQLDLRLHDISGICRASAEAAKEHTGREIKLSIPSSCIALTEQRLIRTALCNLLSNAVKVTPKDGDITLSLTDSPEFITLTVSDRGEGLKPELFESLLSGWRRTVSFDEYRYLARENASLGFGLPIVKSVAQLHGGSLLLSQREGGGSELHMTIAKNLEVSEECLKLHMPVFIDDGYKLEDIEFSVF